MDFRLRTKIECRCQWFLALLFITMNLTVTAAESESSSANCQQAINRPCVALVLGGGGARGGAHIGVLQVLEQQQIPVDMIVGTSIGSFVGGLYATGKSADEIENLFLDADWNAGYRDKISRADIPIRRKQQLDSYPIQLDLGIGAKGIKLPRGFIQGQAMKALIDKMLGVYVEFETFDALPIPYRAVAADAETGEEVVLDGGDLATAMQSSMSIPGIVRPIEQQQRILVDGGIANNLPISVAKAMGADVVIAVNIGSPPLKRDELNSGFAILRQLTSFLTTRNVDYQKSLLLNTDILIEPIMEDVGMLDFDNVAKAIQAGHTAAEMAFNESKLRGLRQLNSQPQPLASLDEKIRIDQIEIVNTTRLSDNYIKKRINIEAGSLTSLEKIHTGVNRLYGQGTFSRVTTRLAPGNGGNTLHVNAEEKDWGPGYMDFKLSFEDDFDSFSHYQLGFSYRLTNLSKYGAEWFTSAEFGTKKIINTDLYWPLGNSNFFLLAATGYKREVLDVRQENLSLGNVAGEVWESHMGTGWHPLDKLQFRLSAMYVDANLNIPWVLSSLTEADNISATRSGAALNIDFDSIDNASFPTRGWKLTAELHRTKDEVLDTTGYSNQVDSQYNGVLSAGRHSLRTLLRYQSTVSDNELSILGDFQLGGFLNLSGTERESISGQHVRFASLVYTYKLAENDFGALDLPLYLGASAEAGNAWQRQSDVDYAELINSGSFFIGWDSPLGPAYLAYGKSDNHNQSIYVFLGVVF